jgi:CSLREA domain-containing protein
VRYPAVLFATAVALLVGAPPAAAVTIHVDVQNDEDNGSCAAGDCSLREAVTYAPVGATIEVPTGTYPVDSELAVPRTMTIDGAGPASTVITGQDSVRTIHDTAGPVTLRDLQVTGGSALTFGGGILDTSGKLLTLDHVRVTDNIANSSGAAITAGGAAGVGAMGPVTVRHSTIDNNSSFLQATGSLVTSGGGGIFVLAHALTITDSEVRDNALDADGATSSDEPVSLNGGGGIRVAGSGASLTLTRSTVAGNHVGVAGQSTLDDNGGGGIYVSGGSFMAVNSTISDNQAHVPVTFLDNGGGGVFTKDASAALLNVTIAGNDTSTNTTMDAGGALYRDGGSVRARNTLIAANTADVSANCFGSITSQGHNLEDADTCGLTGPGDRTSTPITLGALAANGGPTRTRAIFANGPAFNTGLGCPATDQRGVARPKGTACDRGAFELAVPNVVTGGAKQVKPKSARLTGAVVPNGSATTYFFQYGETKAYGKKTGTKSAGAGSLAKPASGRVKGLKAVTRYHYRLVAENARGTTLGGDRTFTTRMKLPAKCVGPSGRLSLKLQHPSGAKIVLAKGFVKGKLKGTASGTDVRELQVDDLPQVRFTLTVTAKLANGRKLSGSRKYRPCK